MMTRRITCVACKLAKYITIFRGRDLRQLDPIESG